MRRDPDDRSDIWDVRDPAKLLRRMASETQFLPEEIRLASVEDASTECRFLGQLRLEPGVVARADEDSHAGYDRRHRLLDEAVAALPAGPEEPGPPWTTVVLVSARYGRVVTGMRGHLWDEAVHFCNEYAMRWMLRGDHVLLTEHGWLVQGTSLVGARPHLRAPRRRPVARRSAPASVWTSGQATRQISSASRTSSSRAGSG